MPWLSGARSLAVQVPRLQAVGEWCQERVRERGVRTATRWGNGAAGEMLWGRGAGAGWVGLCEEMVMGGIVVVVCERRVQTAMAYICGNGVPDGFASVGCGWRWGE